MNVVDTEVHFLDEHCGADLPDGIKLYANPSAPRGVTEEMVEVACEKFSRIDGETRRWPDGWSEASQKLVRETMRTAITAAMGGESEKPTAAVADAAKRIEEAK